MPKLNTAKVAAKQDAQVAKQAAMQIAHNAKADADRSKLADKGGKRAPTPKAEPTAKAKPVTKGASGVATGAATQPHTKQAVREEAKLVRRTVDGVDEVKAKNPDGNMVWVPANDPKLVCSGDFGGSADHYVVFANKGAAKAFRDGQAALAKAKAKAGKGTKVATGAAKAATPPKAKAKPPVRKAAGDRTYAKGVTPITAKAGTWTRYMLDLVVKHTSTEACKEAHRKTGQFQDHPVDFNWAAKRGYITFAA